ncbi:MAG: DNA replication and repair protein RecF [Oleiphilaceae bacterium]|nr:DNA replication and repair protein RecF [Oleiphilaceae bacterium]
MINRFQVAGFRNLKDQTLQFSSPFTIVFGNNGSGKTSFLESIYTALNGKSFRSGKTKNIISNNSNKDSFIVRAELEFSDRSHQVALRKSLNDKYVAKVDGDFVQSISELASIYPTQIVEPRSFNVFDGGASSRRRLYDWMMFHVEHSFNDLLKVYQSCLKQRNALLRKGVMKPSQLAPWDRQLSYYGSQINNLRFEIFKGYQNYFESAIGELLSPEIVEHITITLKSGWDSNQDLSNVLAESIESDIKKRTTQFGPHRADLKIAYSGLPIQERLSRGQQKLVVLAIHLANLRIVREQNNSTSLLLLDDLAAELDEPNLERLLCLLYESGTSVIATTLDTMLYSRVLERCNLLDKTQMFHVEHGKISDYK